MALLAAVQALLPLRTVQDSHRRRYNGRLPRARCRRELPRSLTGDLVPLQDGGA